MGKPNKRRLVPQRLRSATFLVLVVLFTVGTAAVDVPEAAPEEPGSSPVQMSTSIFRPNQIKKEQGGKTASRSLDDTDVSVINSNFAMEAKLNPVKDSLVLEDSKSPYVNIVAVRKGDETRPEIVKLMKALQSPEVKKFIEEKYKGAVVAAF